jgi:hypothetical protein
MLQKKESPLSSVLSTDVNSCVPAHASLLPALRR